MTYLVVYKVVNLVKIFNGGSIGVANALNTGNELPKWYPTPTKQNAYFGESAEKPEFHYSVDNSNNVYIQYGKNADGWASIRFFIYSLEVLNEKINPDNSITARLRFVPKLFKTLRTDYARGGYSVEYDITVNNNKIWSYRGNTIDEFTLNEKESMEFEIVIPPQQTSYLSTLNVSIKYPNGETPNRDMYIGISLQNNNPIPPQTYRPMAIRKNSIFKSLDIQTGKLLKRVSGVFVDIPLLQYNSINTENGSCRIRKETRKIQQSKVGK